MQYDRVQCNIAEFCVYIVLKLQLSRVFTSRREAVCMLDSDTISKPWVRCMIFEQRFQIKCRWFRGDVVEISVTVTEHIIWNMHTVRDSSCFITKPISHYDDVIMGSIASQITSLTIVYSIVYSADKRKHQSSASLAFVWGIHRGPVNSPHKWPVTRKMFPFDDVIMRSMFQGYFIITAGAIVWWTWLSSGTTLNIMLCSSVRFAKNCHYTL